MSIVMSNIRKKVAKLRSELLECIKEFMESRKVNVLDVTFSTNCPIIVNGEDDWDTYTLDRITLQTNPENTLYRIWLDGSSSYDNTTIAADNLDLEMLAYLVEWLGDNAEKIDEELAEE